MRSYGKYLWIPFVYGIIFSIYGTFRSRVNVPCIELIIDMGFGQINSCTLQASVGILEGYVPYFVYIILFSTYIYRHFCNSSVYFFSRCEKRGKWLRREMWHLYGFGVLYLMVLTLGRSFPGMLVGRLVWDRQGCILLLYFIFIMSLWLFQTALLGNTVTILFGSYYGVALTCGLQIFSVLCLAWIDTENLKGAEIQKLVWNQNAYLILGWNRLKGYTSEHFRNITYGLSPVRGCIYFFVVIILLIGISHFVIQRMDILEDNKEA